MQNDWPTGGVDDEPCLRLERQAVEVVLARRYAPFGAGLDGNGRVDPLRAVGELARLQRDLLGSRRRPGHAPGEALRSQGHAEDVLTQRRRLEWTLRRQRASHPQRTIDVPTAQERISGGIRTEDGSPNTQLEASSAPDGGDTHGAGHPRCRPEPHSIPQGNGRPDHRQVVGVVHVGERHGERELGLPADGLSQGRQLFRGIGAR